MDNKTEVVYSVHINPTNYVINILTNNLEDKKKK